MAASKDCCCYYHVLPPRQPLYWLPPCSQQCAASGYMDGAMLCSPSRHLHTSHVPAASRRDCTGGGGAGSMKSCRISLSGRGTLSPLRYRLEVGQGQQTVERAPGHSRTRPSSPHSRMAPARSVLLHFSASRLPPDLFRT